MSDSQKIVKQLVSFPAEDILPQYKAFSQLFCSKAKHSSVLISPLPPVISDLMLPSCSKVKLTRAAPFFVGSGFQGLELTWMETGSLFVKAMSYSATESWPSNSTFYISPLSLPLQYH